MLIKIYELMLTNTEVKGICPKINPYYLFSQSGQLSSVQP